MAAVAVAADDQGCGRRRGPAGLLRADKRLSSLKSEAGSYRLNARADTRRPRPSGMHAPTRTQTYADRAAVACEQGRLGQAQGRQGRRLVVGASPSVSSDG